MIKKILKYAVICLVLLFMYVPILVLAVYSFTDASNIGAIHAFSFQNYVTLFTTPELQHMIFGSILLAFGSAAIATILGINEAIILIILMMSDFDKEFMKCNMMEFPF